MTDFFTIAILKSASSKRPLVEEKEAGVKGQDQTCQFEKPAKFKRDPQCQASSRRAIGYMSLFKKLFEIKCKLIRALFNFIFF